MVVVKSCCVVVDDKLELQRIETMATYIHGSILGVFKDKLRKFGFPTATGYFE